MTGAHPVCPCTVSRLQFVYEDSMDLIAKLPCIAAKIYRNLYREGSSIGAIDSNLDWSHNFTNMLGYSETQFTELMRLYLTIHRCTAHTFSLSRHTPSLFNSVIFQEGGVVIVFSVYVIIIIIIM